MIICSACAVGNLGAYRSIADQEVISPSSIDSRLPLSATAVPLSCGYDDFGALDESKRSASVPNGQIMPFPVDIVNMTDIKSEEDDSSAEEGSEESDMSSAHANYMEAEEELGTHSADRASMASVLS